VGRELEVIDEEFAVGIVEVGRRLEF